MKDANNEGGSAATSAAANKQYNVTVDGKTYHSTTPTLTGAQIKALAGIDPSFALFLEGHGGAADTQIRDDQQVNLEDHGREKFYSAPPATFGSE